MQEKTGAGIPTYDEIRQLALNNATLPFVLALADRGVVAALSGNPHLMAGLNVHEGQITHAAVAEALGVKHVEAARALGK